MKKLICVLLMFLLTSSVYAEDISGSFTDLSEEHWAYDEIELLKEMQILSGYADGEFKPNEYVTREEFAVMLTKAFGLENEVLLYPSFTDVLPSRWSYSYIEASKDYLTGYYPYGGKPFYQPDLYTTREDVTVALIRALNIEEKSSSLILFDDSKEISRNMRGFIAVAVEEHLISGYEDNTFRPQSPITRAEISILLHKALKQSNYDQKFFLEIEMPLKTHFDQVMITGKTHKDADVWIDGYTVSNDDGDFTGIYHLNNGEGRYNIEIISKMKDGRTKKSFREIEYQLPEGYFKVDVESESTTDEVDASGYIYNYDYEHFIRVNGENIPIRSDGHWDKKLALSQGENHFTFEMIDHYGTTHTEKRIVEFDPQAPEIVFNYFPKTTQNRKIALSGILTDHIDAYPKLYINERPVQVSSGGHFSIEYDLNEGINVFDITAVNKFAVLYKETISISYSSADTEFRDLNYPSRVEKDYYMLDLSCENTSAEEFDLYLDGVYINALLHMKNDLSVRKDYRINLDLSPGENIFTLEVKTNGETVTKEVIIEYAPKVPEIRILSVDTLEDMEIYYLVVESCDEIFTFYNGEKISQTSRRIINDDYYLYYYTVELKDKIGIIDVKNIYGQGVKKELEGMKGE